MLPGDLCELLSPGRCTSIVRHVLTPGTVETKVGLPHALKQGESLTVGRTWKPLSEMMSPHLLGLSLHN